METFPLLSEGRHAFERSDAPLTDVTVPGLRVQADLHLSQLIDRLREETQEVALIEENERVVRLVTDAFEEVAGEVEDPFD